MAKLLTGFLLTLAIVCGCARTITPVVHRNVRENAYWGMQRFPLTVNIVKGLGGCRALKMRQAAARWNSELLRAGAPGPAFHVRETSSMNIWLTGHLWIHVGYFPKGSKTSTLATCSLRYHDDTTQIEGAVITMSENHCLQRTSLHELGHALGLRHSEDSCWNCIMRAVIPKMNGSLVDDGYIQRAELRYVVAQMRGQSSVPYQEPTPENVSSVGE